LQYKTDEIPKEKTEEEIKAEKAKLTTQLFKADEWDDEDFEWKEEPLRPGYARPVIVHRAILGSVERFMAILIEHTGGKWPFFVSPRQAIVCPISEKSQDYCHSVYLYLHQKGWQVECDTSNMTIQKKCKVYSLEMWNFILIAGEEEAKSGQVDIRTRDNKRMGKMRIDELNHYFESLMPKKASMYDEFYRKAWNPADFGGEVKEQPAQGAPKAAPAKVDGLKVNVSSKLCKGTQLLQVVADLVGSNLELVESAEPSKAPLGKMPFACTAQDVNISGVEAIALHLARLNEGAGLLGKGAFQEAKID